MWSLTWEAPTSSLTPIPQSVSPAPSAKHSAISDAWSATQSSTSPRTPSVPPSWPVLPPEGTGMNCTWVLRAKGACGWPRFRFVLLHRFPSGLRVGSVTRFWPGGHNWVLASVRLCRHGASSPCDLWRRRKRASSAKKPSSGRGGRPGMACRTRLLPARLLRAGTRQRPGRRSSDATATEALQQFIESAIGQRNELVLPLPGRAIPDLGTHPPSPRAHPPDHQPRAGGRHHHPGRLSARHRGVGSDTRPAAASRPGLGRDLPPARHLPRGPGHRPGRCCRALRYSVGSPILLMW